MKEHPDQDGAVPFWFGPTSARLLGWYHPAEKVHRNCCVVLCPPFGHEYLVSYRAYRKLAETLAGAGFPVLFFDYDGTGDSADGAGERLAAWQLSIQFAAEQLRQITGIQNLALVGVRLGALLAASMAKTVSASALILIAPTVSGRGFVREQLGFARMSPLAASKDPAHQVGDDEVVGYLLDKQTQADLSKLDLVSTTFDKASLIIVRDDVPGMERKMADAWCAPGADVSISRTPGYAAMMTSDAHNSVPPTAMWDEIRTWLCDRFSSDGGACPVLPSLPFEMEFQAQWREEVIIHNGLAAVLTVPICMASQPVGVVLTNIGTSHRVGNHRLYVNLARSLASQGYAVIRFDRAGTGYSGPTPDGHENIVYAESGKQDVVTAMNCLQARTNIKQFVLGGLCSGAYFSYHAAILDARVTGLFLINILSFQWNHGDSLEMRIRETNKSTEFYKRSVLNPKTWGRLLKGEVNVTRVLGALWRRLRTRSALAVGRLTARMSGKDTPSSDVKRNFKRILDRKAHLLLIFGSEDVSIDVVGTELGANASLLERPELVQVDVVSDTDHTFTPRWAQRYLQIRIGRFLSEHYS